MFKQEENTDMGSCGRIPARKSPNKKNYGPKTEPCRDCQQKNCLWITDDHHFWQRWVKHCGSPIFKRFCLDNLSISWRSRITHNKGHAAALADLTPFAKSNGFCCTKTAKDGSILIHVDICLVHHVAVRVFSCILVEECYLYCKVMISILTCMS